MVDPILKRKRTIYRCSLEQPGILVYKSIVFIQRKQGAEEVEPRFIN
jgi:hypothetical protein